VIHTGKKDRMTSLEEEQQNRPLQGTSLTQKIISKYYRESKRFKLTELIVAGVTAASVLIILVQYIVPLTETQMRTVYVIDFMVVIVLIIDFYFRMKASDEGCIRFTIKHLYEIPAMIPLFTFALLENQTILGATVRGLRLIRLFRLVQFSFRLVRIFEGSRFQYLVVFSITIIVSGAIAGYLVEQPAQGATITSLGDAFWWAISTITLGTYGDVYPVTAEGRLIAAILMFAGLTIFGIFVSTAGAMLVESRLKKGHLGVLDESRLMIKDKIDRIEALTQEDFEDLMLSMRSLRNTLLQKEQNQIKE
jgi:voltage-gated potassium channel